MICSVAPRLRRTIPPHVWATLKISSAVPARSRRQMTIPLRGSRVFRPRRMRRPDSIPISLSPSRGPAEVKIPSRRPEMTISAPTSNRSFPILLIRPKPTRGKAYRMSISTSVSPHPKAGRTLRPRAGPGTLTPISPISLKRLKPTRRTFPKGGPKRLLLTIFSAALRRRATTPPRAWAGLRICSAAIRQATTPPRVWAGLKTCSAAIRQATTPPRVWAGLRICLAAIRRVTTPLRGLPVFRPRRMERRGSIPTSSGTWPAAPPVPPAREIPKMRSTRRPNRPMIFRAAAVTPVSPRSTMMVRTISPRSIPAIRGKGNRRPRRWPVSKGSFRLTDPRRVTIPPRFLAH